MDETKPAAWKTILAFAVIYLVWGSTFLAIRVGVRELPPLLLAGMRFLPAGLLLLGWALARGERLPTRRQWLSVLLLATLIFVFDYGLLFWAEQRVPSGLAAVMMATIPVFTTLAEVLLLGTQRLTLKLSLALLTGLAGVAILVSPSLHLAGVTVEPRGAAALLVGALSWSVATVLTRRVPLPASKAVSSGAQMLTGGMLLMALAGAAGEWHGAHLGAVSHRAWMAELYLIFAGSLLGFTAYLWLIHHHSPTRVGTYAYVNPVVAVGLGAVFAGEPVGLRTLAGTACILFAVISTSLLARR